MELVSVIIPCYNPDGWLLDAIASARRQKHAHLEIVLVNDGTDSSESKAVLKRAAGLADRYIEQSNQGVAAARNAGIRAAAGTLIVPLDCQDILKPEFVPACLRAMNDQPEAAFVYTDYRVFGDLNYIERLGDYNLYDLLELNTLPYAALIRKEDWMSAGGYDESFLGYEDWEFWLQLASRERFGCHVSRALWAYRKQGRSLSDAARERHGELLTKIQSKHPELYLPAARVRIKACWKPAVCVAGPPPRSNPTISDWESVDSQDAQHLLRVSRAETFLFPSNAGYDPQNLELSALAASGGKEAALLPDGSMALPRPVLARFGSPREFIPNASTSRRIHDPIPSTAPLSTGMPLETRRWTLPRCPPRFLETIWRHLANAELLRAGPWIKHPIQSAGRLIPLRFKERVNLRLGRAFFDLDFYLRFQPQSLILGKSLVTLVPYFPRFEGARRRVALITPHLGPGGAETVLLEIAGALDRSQYEILLIATQSLDSRWLPRWRERADHIYDLHSLVPSPDKGRAILSIVANWKCDALLVQNALPCYDVIPHLKASLPGIKIMDMLHAFSGEWDVIRCTAAVAGHLDTRIVISEAGRDHLRRSGVTGEKIRLIRNGIDLDRFTTALACPATDETPARRKRILFAGRLEPVKRPLLLVEIARALLKHRPEEDFNFAIAGDGSEEGALRAAINRAGIGRLFEFLGQVPDLAPEMADSAMLVVTSENEGIPLVLLEAFASGRPAVASNVGAIAEVLDESNGFLIHRGHGEVQEFAAAIHTLLSQPQLRVRMGRNGRRRIVAEYDRTGSAMAYRQLFELPPAERHARDLKMKRTATA